jgi:hypothetical protein
MMQIAKLQRTLTFLDVSFCKQVTDAGFAHFDQKTYPLVSLIMNGLPEITSASLTTMLTTCTDTLVELEAALMDQIKGEFFTVLARCVNLEYLDLTGDKLIDDMAF